MTFELPKLPFASNSLAPHISEETLQYHYGKHHQTYVTNLNNLIAGSEYENKNLIEIVKTAKDAVFNNAGQHLNHSFYWECLSPSNMKPSEILVAALSKSFGSVDKFKDEFTKSALKLFGSGWTWLVKNPKGELAICNTSNAQNPILENQIPLLTCDVWEHAYYIDYRNNRGKYLEGFWNVVNWEFVDNKLKSK